MGAIITLLLIGGGVGLAGGVGYLAWRLQKKRTAAVRGAAERLGWSFQEKAGMEVIPEFRRFGLFGRGHTRKVRNFAAGEAAGLRAALFDFAFTTGGGKAQQTIQQTVCCVHTGSGQLPAFSLRPENVFHRIGEAFGAQDIDLDRHPVFSRAFVLKGEREGAVREAFTPAVVEFFEARPGVHACGEGAVLFLWREGRLTPPDELERLAADAADLARRFAQPPSSQVAIDM